MPEEKRWVRTPIGCTILLVVVLGLIFLLETLTDDSTSTRFRSPSGTVTIRIVEICFGFACSQTAYLVRPLWDKHLEDLNVGDPEGIVFDKRATATWNKDETEMTWRVKTRHGTKTGVLDLQ